MKLTDAAFNEILRGKKFILNEQHGEPNNYPESLAACRKILGIEDVWEYSVHQRTPRGRQSCELTYASCVLRWRMRCTHASEVSLRITRGSESTWVSLGSGTVLNRH